METGWKLNQLPVANDLIRYDCLVKPPWKPEKDGFWRASCLVNTGDSGSVCPFPHFLSCVFLLSGYSWVIHSYHKLVIYLSKMFSWVLGTVLSNYLNSRRESLEPSISNQSEAQVTTWTFDWLLKWGQGNSLVELKPLTCEIRWCLQVESVKIELSCRPPSWNLRIA